jgi:hypothetical protein
VKEMKGIDYCSSIVISRDEDHYIMTLQKTGETVECQFAAAYCSFFTREKRGGGNCHIMLQQDWKD